MKHVYGCSFVVLLTSICLAAQDTSSPYLSSKPAEAKKSTIRVYIPEQTLKDADRAALYKLTAKTVPVDNWPIVQIEHQSSVPILVDRYFDIYQGLQPGTAGANPKTAALLSAMIREANNVPYLVPSSTEIRLPPVPVRGFSHYAEGVQLRTFDAALQQYSLQSAKFALLDTSATHSVAAVPDLRDWRSGNVTSIEMKLDPALQAEAAKTLPRVAIAISDDNFDLIHLLDDPPGTCAEGLSWLTSSSYLPNLQTSLGALAKANLLATAANTQLVIVDWDFQSPVGHGRKVLAVVKQVLTQLHLEYLIPTIQTLDLHPKYGADRLKQILNDYQQFFSQLPEWSHQDLKPIFSDALRWVGKDPDAEDAREQKVPSLVLQAVFWKLFGRDHTIINLSFSIESTAFSIANPRWMTGTKSFGVLAAGNSGLELSTVMMPQAEASAWPSLLNVTYGKSDGTVLGDFSNDHFGRLVNVIAPGCGYQFEDVKPADAGSSFASPYVAVAAWLVTLTKPGLSISELKRNLVMASLATPPNGDRVQSGGTFDFAGLFSHSQMHILDRQNHVTPLSDGTLSVRYKSAGIEASISFNLGASIQGRSFTLFTCENGQTCLWYNEWSKGSLAPNRIEAPITSLEFKATTLDGQSIEIHDPGTFLTTVRQLNF